MHTSVWDVWEGACLRLAQLIGFPWFKPPNPQALRARPLVVPRAHPNYDAETLEQNWVAPQSSLYEMDVNCGFCRALWKMNELGLDSVNSGLAASEQVGSPPPPRSLRNLLDGEMEHSAALRQEVDTLKRKVAEQEERHVTKVQALAR